MESITASGYIDHPRDERHQDTKKNPDRGTASSYQGESPGGRGLLHKLGVIQWKTLTRQK
jgi:hypothetical protein